MFLKVPERFQRKKYSSCPETRLLPKACAYYKTYKFLKITEEDIFKKLRSVKKVKRKVYVNCEAQARVRQGSARDGP